MEIAEQTLSGRDLHRDCHATNPQRFYWIIFDEPQEDADGDGPYVAGEVLEKYVELLED